MPGVDVVDAVRHFGERQRLFMVRLRNTRGHVPTFRDAFLDDGDVSVPEVLRTCRAVGYGGPVRAATPPLMEGDTAWGHRARALDLGYVRALLRALEREPA